MAGPADKHINRKRKQTRRKRKGKRERARRRKGGEEKKAMAAILGFIMVTLEIVFGRKNCWIDGKGPFGDNRS